MRTSIIVIIIICNFYTSYGQLTIIDPITAEDYSKQAHQYLESKNYLSALASIRQAHTLDQHNPSIQFTYAYILGKNDLLQEAINLYDQLLINNPDNSSILHNKAYTLKVMGKFNQAIPLYQQVLRIHNDFEHAKLGLSHCYWATGQLTLAWPLLEYRFSDIKNCQATYKHHLITPELLLGKTVTILAEWSLGDMIQCIRYAPILKKYGATHITLQAFKPLIPLLSQSHLVDTIIGQDEPLPVTDFYIPLVSLPLVCKTTLETIPCNIPYIQADPDLVTHWHHKIEQIEQDHLLHNNYNKRFRIGICWCGKPGHTLEDSCYTARPAPLKLFSELTKIPTVQLYSLQQQFGMEEIDMLKNLPLEQQFSLYIFDTDFDVTNGRYMDTAAVIKNLDLIISIDTSIVHVAGALGVPVWVMIPYTSEFRWFSPQQSGHAEFETTTPWYPTMKLYRQETPGDWQSVMARIQHDLEKFLL